ncbi:hypothetical protein [Streptomyces sp. H27-C3]|uniref:hypothetical protein n=1 Tax=Streptomyces sp. H27-C3 TaxID=3046305 RepID=UPI0024BBC424|nr:hypothetical protein [Streptomyces sp. H27-C3]MDJ0461690.1 hypothetical protein [Streptomyces sp. H27-C3]
MGSVGRSTRRAGIGCTLALLVALTGCGGTGTSEITPSDSPAPRRTTPAEVCASLVSYWAKEALRGGKWAGIDWEQKGFSNDQYELHEQILAAARAEQRKRGAAAAEALIGRESQARCEAAKGATGSSENWRPPR